MKPSTEVRVSELKMNITVGIEPTICAPKTARLPAAIIVIFISAQRYNYFLNHQTKNRKKSLIDAKNMENYTKRPKMHHKEGKSNVPTDKNMITQHFVTKNKLFC